MHGGADVYRFGPFELDGTSRRLLRGRDAIDLPDRHLQVLLVLVSNAGHIVPKESLIQAVWRDAAVADASCNRAIWNVRKVLGRQADGREYVETRTRQGYRFVAQVAREKPRKPAVMLDAVLAPYRALVDGRAALDTLNAAAIAQARQQLEAAVRTAPNDAAAHVDLANACVLLFESTRADAAPDLLAVEQADEHAREGCRLDPSSGEAWSTLAFVLNRKGERRESIAAARRAVTLEPDNWRHHLRFAYVAWGEERIRAAQRALALYPELALAHWLAATVFIARQAFDPALAHVRAGCAAQDAQGAGAAQLNTVGLHLQHGLVLAARGALDEALEEFHRELAAGNRSQLYARECSANTCYSLGALRLRAGRRNEAETAFREALMHVPGHGLASVGLAALSGSFAEVPCNDTDPVDVAVVRAAALACEGKHQDAARICAEALLQAEPGQAGWLLPVEPMLNVAARPEPWAPALAALRHRAA